MVRLRRAGSQIKFKITVDPSPAAVGRFAKATVKGLDDWRPVFAELVPIFRRELRANFDGRGELLGRWAPNSDAYELRKGKKGGGRAQLVLSGDTRRELLGPPLRMSKKVLIMGVTTPQARALQWGGHGRKGGKRPIVGWTNGMRRAALEAANRAGRKRLIKAARVLARESGRE